MNESVRDVAKRRFLVEAGGVVELGSMDDLVKLKYLPEYVNVGGYSFRLAGGSASSMDTYLRSEHTCYMTVYPAKQDGGVYSKEEIQQIKTKLGAWSFKLVWKVNGLSLVPSKVVPVR